MERLTQNQSDFLKQINSVTIELTKLTEEEKAICSFLASKKYITYHTIRKAESDSNIFRSWTETISLSISEAGKMYLINEQLSDEQQNYLKEQMNSLKYIADSAKTQAKLATEAADIAKQESDAARHDAIFSKVISIIAIIISIVAIVVPLIY